MFEDLDRIEVIRGPGATLWGANAVNGIINIVTRSAEDTQGGLVTAGVGTEELLFGAGRFGGRIGQGAFYRVYVKYFDRDGLVDASGADTADGWDGIRGGFRIDWQMSEHDTIALQGDVYGTDYGETLIAQSFVPPYGSLTVDASGEALGGNICGWWRRVLSDTSEIRTQINYDRTERESLILDDIHDTAEIDFQHRFALGGRNEITWGAGYRYVSDELEGSTAILFDPWTRDDDLVSAFLQDEITVARDLLQLTVGSKVEHNDYSGWEVQPSARLLYRPLQGQSFWSSVSRAVRSPSRAEHDVWINSQMLPAGSLYDGSPPALLALVGDDDFDSEKVIAYELGYRGVLTDSITLDVAAFCNVYDGLRTLEMGTPYVETALSSPSLVVPLSTDNRMDGRTYGAEASMNWQAMDWCRIKIGYAYLEMDLELDSGSTDTVSEAAEDESPRHQLFLQSLVDLPANFELDGTVRYVDDLTALGIDGYAELGLRLGWKPAKHLEVSVIGENLLDDRHQEFLETGIVDTLPTLVERSVYGKITWQF